MNGNDEDFQRISITIPEWMYQWLDEHKEINRSKLFREAVLREQQVVTESKKMSPLMFLASVMGIVFSIALIGIGITPTPIHIWTRGLLALLGGFLAFMTGVLYFKESKKIKAIS